MKKISQSHHSSLNELNITPLLDLAFVLLVIFIITTPQLANNLELNLPSAERPAGGPPPEVHQLMVDLEGRILLDRRVVTLDGLRAALERIKAANPDPAIVLRGAGDVDYQKVVAVLDVLQQLEIAKVGLATETL
jgi:biopolymer transport protein ExbD